MIQRLKNLRKTLRHERGFVIVGIGFAALFLPMHTIYPGGLWTINRMGWWIGFLVYVNEAYKEYKENKKPVVAIPLIWRPTTAKWVSRWGMSWKALIIVIPTMSIAFFFVMLAVFA